MLSVAWSWVYSGALLFNYTDKQTLIFLVRGQSNVNNSISMHIRCDNKERRMNHKPKWSGDKDECMVVFDECFIYTLLERNHYHMLLVQANNQDADRLWSGLWSSGHFFLMASLSQMMMMMMMMFLIFVGINITYVVLSMLIVRTISLFSICTSCIFELYRFYQFQ